MISFHVVWDQPQLSANLSNPLNQHFSDFFIKTVKPFRVPVWGLFPLIQTIWTVLGRPHPIDHDFKREILKTHSGGVIAVDWFIPEEQFPEQSQSQRENEEKEIDLLSLPYKAFNKSTGPKKIIGSCTKQLCCDCSPFEVYDKHQSHLRPLSSSMSSPSLRGTLSPNFSQDTPSDSTESFGLYSKSSKKKGVIFLVPGLTNCSDTQYVKLFSQHCKENGWIPVVYIWRGLGGLPLTSERLFEPGDCADFQVAVQHVQNRMGNGLPIAAIGWSLGANLLCKYLGEFSESSPFFAAASVGQGYDAAEAFRRLPNYVLKKIGGNFQKIVNHHKHLFQTSHDLHQVLKPGLTIQEFDEKFTLRVFRDKYQTLDDYYNRNSCLPFLKNISIPVLLLNSKDDPVVPPSLFPHSVIEENKNLVLVTTNYGGHLGFAKGLLRADKYSWADEFCLQWFHFIRKNKFGSVSKKQ